MDDWPFTSIIVPVFNGSHTIDASLQSLLALNYPQDKYEIIVVDNNSQDDTPQRVQQYSVKLLYEQEMQSPYAARNRGIKAAKGEIIALTDATCVAHPDWLNQLLVDYKDTCWGGFAGSLEAYQPFTNVQRHMAQVKAHVVEPSLMQQPFLAPQSRGERLCSRFSFLDYRADISLPSDLINAATCNVAYRRQIFDEVGYFNPHLVSCGDYVFAWQLQTQTNWKINFIPTAIIYYQYRPDLSGMARQFRRNGWSYGVLALKYNSNPYQAARKMGVESVILLILSVSKYLSIFCVRLLRKLFYRPADDLYLKSPLYTMVRVANFYYGRLIAAIKANGWLSQISSESFGSAD